MASKMKRAFSITFVLAAITLSIASCNGAPNPSNKDGLTVIGEQLGEREFVLLGKIRSAKTFEARERHIAELEATPEKIHPYYRRWFILYDVRPFHCWTNNGYDPSLSEVPRDVQILSATSYGIADIQNGGFFQFFCNDTGAFAPEMIEWFERADMPEAARLMKKATAEFGDQFSRSQADRRRFLGYGKSASDPFHGLEEPFFDAVSGSDSRIDMPLNRRFVDKANRWLRETCGIADLRTEYKVDGHPAVERE